MISDDEAVMELPSGLMLATVPGEVVIPPLVPVAGPVVQHIDQRPEDRRTEPYSFRELAERWKCCLDTVEKTVRQYARGKRFKIGRQYLLTPAAVLAIEHRGDRL